MTDSRVQLDLPHRVRFTRGVFDLTNPTLADLFPSPPTGSSVNRPPSPRAKLLVVADQGLVDARPALQCEMERYFARDADGLPSLVGFRDFPGGETIKNDLSLVKSLLSDFHRYQIDRHAYVLAIGGGALLDAVGFAAAIAHRGVRLIRMPTTTLAQADSGVGVKNAVNLFGQKNFIGTFAVPYAVVNDADLLASLPLRDWRAGLAEVLKVALLKDPDLYHTLRRHAARLADGDPALADPLWQRSAQLHLDHITAAGDPFEQHAARPLDFGHWAAHKLETLSGYRLRHGEAVALGLALDTAYAARVGLLDPDLADEICHTLAMLGFTLTDPTLNDPDFLAGLEDFRQHLGGTLTVTLIRDLGRPVEVHHIDPEMMQQCIDRFAASGFSLPTTAGTGR
ncbi:MAG: 3-dehydroquinate synthase [Planctomycetota bacterium]